MSSETEHTHCNNAGFFMQSEVHAVWIFLGETLNGHFYQLTIFEQFSVKTGISPTILNNFTMHKKGYCIVL